MSLNNFKIFKKYTKLLSYGVFAISLIIGLILIFKFRSIGPYSMTLSYYVLLPTLVYLDDIMENFSIIKFINFILSLLIIIALGSRGAILCIIFYTIMKLFKLRSKNTFRNLLFLYTLLCITIVFVVNFEGILLSVNELLLNFNIESRTISLFLRDEVHLSGRNELYSQTIRAIAENSIFGIGIGGDRLILNGVYVHNIFLEIVANYGIILGSFLIILLALLIIKSIKSKNLNKYNLVIFWISFGLVHLVVSGSYLIDIRFWIFIGLLINLNFRRPSRSIKY